MHWNKIADWPNASLSRRINGPIHRWHVQEVGVGKTVLLLHGAGGSTHSFRDLLLQLSTQYHVIALDLPGHGFTQLGARHRSGLDLMAKDIAALCIQEGWAPDVIVGHSAGAAVAFQLAAPDLLQREYPHIVIGINAALSEFKGIAGLLFPTMAKTLAALPFTARLFSGASSNPARVEALINSTGSILNAQGLELYRKLIADQNHVDGTLLMMAQWQLRPLLNQLSKHKGDAYFIVGDRDRTVLPHVSEDAAEIIPNAKVHYILGSGHLAHEEQPIDVASIIHSIIAKQPI